MERKEDRIGNNVRIGMLGWRDGILDTVLDTDAATEVDDPFAISYLLLSPERFSVKAIYAAPFAMNERAQDPGTGMEMSYQEILHVMRLCRKEGHCAVLKGSGRWMGRIRQRWILRQPMIWQRGRWDIPENIRCTWLPLAPEPISLPPC